MFVFGLVVYVNFVGVYDMDKVKMLIVVFVYGVWVDGFSW